ncbi:hypothetical protein [Vibrio coralliilyticus]|uniref:hypothetical protein n=1 Tax=Vibrio coralliilyticus TaxID=190893 RepID=UPI001E476F98|nr:hypothetical protein [Vibrio coralliilyticus]MCC2525799.1 hypothetical protein [Vibrio coralliilyticus]
MKIEDKLALSRKVASGEIVGVAEGLFIRFYNEALFAWQQWVKAHPELPVLKVSAKPFKKLDGQVILYGGLPYSTLEKRGVKLDENGTISISFETDMSGWEEWYEHYATAKEKVTHQLIVCQDESQCYIRIFLPKSLVGKIQDFKDTDCVERSLLLSELKHFIAFK